MAQDIIDLNKYFQAVKRLQAKHGVITWEMRFGEMICIIAGLELALRHPEFPQTTKQIITNSIQQILQQIGKEEPDLKLFIEMGFNPEFDVETESRQVH